MTKTTINTIEMTRAIREQHAQTLQNATPAERIAFYQAKARTMQTVASASSSASLSTQQNSG